MRNFNIVIVIFVTFSACRPDNKSSELAKAPLLEESFEYFGTQIADSNAITAGLLLVKLQKNGYERYYCFPIFWSCNRSL